MFEEIHVSLQMNVILIRLFELFQKKVLSYEYRLFYPLY